MAAGVAVIVACVVLVTAVLPAEYGIDPLGVGRALGLTALSDAGEETASLSVDAGTLGVNTTQTGALAQDVFTVELRPFEGVEYKYRLEQGAGLVYTWTASGVVGYDFHGEPDGAPARYSESYGKGDSASASGVFVAPKPGIHGWFWENPGAGRITVTLTTSGFYTASTEYRDGERYQRTFGQ
jgi:hypothetical protein